ncbi:MAG: hypothetical protein PHI50_00675 [Alphaproteobacteria bacterium]|nr:hypothetical protein [Alphaproteobacteria bacterium]
MKVAVELFGHLRTYRKCYKSLQKHLLKKYDCDVFMHTWSTLNHNTQTWHKNKMINGSSSTYSKEEELQRIYNLKGLLIEEQKPKDLGNIIAIKKEMSIFGISCMFHSMQEVNCLREKYARENNIQYDFVVMVRPDIFLKKDFDIEKFIDRLTDEEINNSYFTAGFPMTSLLSEFRMLGATDLLFFAKPQLLSDIFKSTDKILANFTPNKCFNNGPEYFLPKAVQDLGYKTIFVNYTLGDCFEMLRATTFSNLRKQLFRVRIRKNGIKVYLLQMLMTTLLRLKIDLFDCFQIDFCIGNLKDKK